MGWYPLAGLRIRITVNTWPCRVGLGVGWTRWRIWIRLAGATVRVPTPIWRVPWCQTRGIAKGDRVVQCVHVEIHPAHQADGVRLRESALCRGVPAVPHVVDAAAFAHHAKLAHKLKRVGDSFAHRQRLAKG